MSGFKLSRFISVVMLLMLSSVFVYADWSSQKIDLRPGWNAVFLEVHPRDNICDVVFAGVPVKSVWAWNRRFTTAQYVRDPSTLLPEQPEWLTYFPTDSPNSFLTDLYAVYGGRCYLIELGGDAPASVVLWGSTVVRKKKWMSNSFNLAGFHVDPAKSPTFGNYFKSAESFSKKIFYSLSTSGKWEKITNADSAMLKYGEAYWIYCDGQSDFSGPFMVECDSRNGLQYSSISTEQILRLNNKSSSPKTVTLKLKSSNRPSRRNPDKSLLPVAGDVALSYLKILDWEPLEKPLTLIVDAESERGVRLAVRRAAMSKALTPDSTFESVLEVSDGEGIVYHVPVSAQKNASNAGLWVGTVVLNGVSEASNTNDPLTPRPTASEMQFRLILHLDDGDPSVTHLLKEVMMMQVQTTFTTNDSGNTIIDTPSRYVLLTDDSKIPEYELVSMQGGKVVGRRISSPVFAFSSPMALTGTFSNKLDGTISMDYDDPLNPFVHRYHPDHNNMDERYKDMLSEGKESFTFFRAITLEFTATDPEQLDLPNWGYDIIGGIYKEKISGVHQNDIYVQGTFRLTKVSDVAKLNDEQ